MAYSTLFEGVIFVEGDDISVQKVAQINCDLSRTWGAQLKNLNDVKKVLADQAKANNCNCVVNFEYGQKSRWRFMFDDVGFYGSGIASVLSPIEYQSLIDKIRSR
jgi:hypothetical protein